MLRPRFLLKCVNELGGTRPNFASPLRDSGRLGYIADYVAWLDLRILVLGRNGMRDVCIAMAYLVGGGSYTATRGHVDCYSSATSESTPR